MNIFTRYRFPKREKATNTLRTAKWIKIDFCFVLFPFSPIHVHSYKNYMCSCCNQRVPITHITHTIHTARRQVRTWERETERHVHHYIYTKQNARPHHPFAVFGHFVRVAYDDVLEKIGGGANSIKFNSIP